jgi:acetaldehyde dehydrogenase/alcohol dehydrogenase
MDVLTHAIEAYVSTLANDYTDALALQAIKLTFDYLKRSVDFGANDPLAREKMHNASTIAGMAFGNAFLGISHSMAHKIGAKFHLIHGRTNAILLPYVVLYNGERPQKLSTWPKNESYIADQKYADIARFIGLKFNTVSEGVTALSDAIYALGTSIGIKMSFKDQGVDEKAYLEALDTLAYQAYEDQCSPANPRLPMVADMKEILKKAYYGR